MLIEYLLQEVSVEAILHHQTAQGDLPHLYRLFPSFLPSPLSVLESNIHVWATYVWTHVLTCHDPLFELISLLLQGGGTSEFNIQCF